MALEMWIILNIYGKIGKAHQHNSILLLSTIQDSTKPKPILAWARVKCVYLCMIMLHFMLLMLLVVNFLKRQGISGKKLMITCTLIENL